MKKILNTIKGLNYKILLKILFVIFIVLVVFFISVLTYVLLQKPSLDRNWSLDQKVLSDISFSGNIIDIKNIRNIQYKTETDYDLGYYDKSFDINKVDSVYYIIEPFSKYDGPAHTMLSFGFEDGSYLSVSAEIRKEVGETFSPLKGILNQYEVVYVVGDEKDLVKLRTNYRKDDVYMYPIKTSKENIKNMFLSVMKRADKLNKQPEFYNTFTNTCITNILIHLNELRDGNGKDKVKWSKDIFLPANSDKIAYELGLIDNSISLDIARKQYKINSLAEKYADNKHFSKLIRIDNKDRFLYLLDHKTDSSITKFVDSRISFDNKGYVPENLEKISSKYVYDAKGGRQLLRDIANENLQKMSEEFYKEFGKKVVVVSAYRSYLYQKGIKDRGCPDNLCAKAGYSEHQSGLGVDFWEASTQKAWLSNPRLMKYYNWLDNNAHKFGFHNTYQRGLKVDGYEIEPWHWRYLGEDFATYLKNKNLTIAEYYYSKNK